MVRRQIEQGDFKAGARRGHARRQQIAHVIPQVQPPLHGHLRQQQAGERLADGADLEEGIRPRGTVRHHPPHAVLGDADHDARAAIGGRKVHPAQQRRDVAVHHGWEIRGVHRCQRRIENQRRSGYRIELRQRQRPGDACRHVQSRQSQSQRRSHRRDFRQKQSARAYRQRTQHQNIAPVRKSGFPTEHREQAHYQHGGSDQKVLHGPCADHVRQRRSVASRSGPHRGVRGQTETAENQQRRKLPQQRAAIALGVRGEQFQIHNPEQELAVKHPELQVLQNSPLQESPSRSHCGPPE